MKLKKVSYKELNSRQKENYNFHKVSAVLADYGYNSMRLNDDWQGADFISVHVTGCDMLKVQLKGRCTISRKYVGKNIFVAYLENDHVHFYDHDRMIKKFERSKENWFQNVAKSISWADRGLYTWKTTPSQLKGLIEVL